MGQSHSLEANTSSGSHEMYVHFTLILMIAMSLEVMKQKAINIKQIIPVRITSSPLKGLSVAFNESS